MNTACQVAVSPCHAATIGRCAAAPGPEDDREAIERGLAEWRPHYRLTTPAHRAAFELMVTCAIRLERCRAEESALRRRERCRAASRWDEDRRAEADALGKGLSRQPSAVASRLEQTKQGVEWKLERWRALGDLLEEQGGAWDAKQTAQALDLIGRPKELRGKAPRVADPAALVAAQVARLEALRADSLDAMDALEREMAMAGTPAEPSAAMLRLRRHEAACLRDYRRTSRELRDQRVTPAPAAPAPKPAQAPAPTPEPAGATPGAGAVQGAPPRRAHDAGPPPTRPTIPPALSSTPTFVPVMVTGSQPERFRS